MDEVEREQSRLFVDGEGRLRSAADGSLFDTTGGGTVRSSGRAIFVMDGHGNLYATMDQQVGHIHHSSLLGGADVAGAGDIRVDGGRLVDMTDQSGHYQPTAETNDRALDALRSQGLQPSDGFKQYGWNEQER
jgi:hypothetical protein